MTALYIILLWYFELKHIKITWLKIKAKEKAADWAAFHFLKAAQIWCTRPMRYSPVQADQKKPIWAANRQSGNTACGIRAYQVSTTE